ncbi:MAG: (4Fe-4S)-binding protein [Acidobacteria bacterium]|nr:(4Fe-4S)-binding protein [Acidobacteriota bacterium]
MNVLICRPLGQCLRLLNSLFDWQQQDWIAPDPEVSFPQAELVH